MLTVISESVAPMHGGKGDTRANLENYRAEYYGAIAMVAIGLVVSFFFFLPHTKQEKQQQENQNQETKDERDEKCVDGKKKEEEEKESPSSDETRTDRGERRGCDRTKKTGQRNSRVWLWKRFVFVDRV